ncbi:Bestrophin [Paragonimus heterotremus]|uniref:Bestrophin homolog n=1 Tax=Paragonimus heterotremus TaxID=100268 RepID=A0A8J4TF74_9TREM|nr:Bestrophin [Paragonimus heterotremus]
MTTFYADDLTDGQGGLVFFRILKRWKGSLYKLVWIDLLIYISAYYVLNLSYRFAMNDSQKKVFEGIVEFCEKTKGDIPISFLLGFFVAGIIGRWYRMYMYIPWMNEVALHVASSINGHDELGARKIRLTIMRYLNLSWILMMRLISDQIATRFSYSEEDDSTNVDVNADAKAGSLRKSSRAKHKSAKPHKQKISRNTCHPWSIDATEAFKTNQSRSFLQPSARHDLSVPVSSEPITPCTPFVAPLATTEGGFPYPDAFQAEDDPNLRADLLSFNRDPQVRRTFGIIITDADIAAFQRTAVECFRRTKVKYTPEYWIPIQWAQRLVLKALQSGYILDPKIAYYLIGEIGDVRKQMQDLQIFSSIMIPLVYTQVVIIAVYSYFMCQIFACQFVESRQNEDTGKIDLYVPIFSIFSFLFLMGWLKVALCVMNPFGDDDEDFQTSSILDYNLEVSFRSVYMDDSSFPQYLSFPLGKSLPKDKPDDLEKFLNDIDCDLNQLMSNPVENNVCNLEMRPTRMSQCKNCFCCNRPRESMPKVIVTNVEDPTANNRQSTLRPSQKKWNWM